MTTLWGLVGGADLAKAPDNPNRHSFVEDWQPLYDRNMQAVFVGTLAVLAVWALFSIGKRRLIAALAGGAVLLVCTRALLLYASRSGAISTLTGALPIMILSTWILWRKQSKAVVVLISVTIGIVVVASSMQGDVANYLMSRFRERDVMTGDGRLGYATELLAFWCSAPVFEEVLGIGEGSKTLGLIEHTSVVGVHNGYVAILMEQGLVGLAFFLLCLGCIFHALWKNFSAEHLKPGHMIALGLAVFLCIFNLTLDIRFTDLWWICMGIVLGFACEINPQPDSSARWMTPYQSRFQVPEAAMMLAPSTLRTRKLKQLWMIKVRRSLALQRSLFEKQRRHGIENRPRRSPWHRSRPHHHPTPSGSTRIKL
jgi:hypothetical protein